MLQGGKFGHGFISAGVVEAVSPTVMKIPNSYAKVAVSALVGGSVSAATGGKFGNGAITGAFQMAFNELAHGDVKNQRVKKRPFLEGEITMLSACFDNSLPWEAFSISQKDIGPVARTIGSTITYDTGGDYEHDFSSSAADYNEVQTFFHEVGHFWKYKNSNGGAYFQIIGRYVVSGGNSAYKYSFDVNKKLSSYQREQQAEIIGDYCAANYFGRSSIQNSGLKVPIADYRTFLQNSGFPQ